MWNKMEMSRPHVRPITFGGDELQAFNRIHQVSNKMFSEFSGTSLDVEEVCDSTQIARIESLIKGLTSANDKPNLRKAVTAHVLLVSRRFAKDDGLDVTTGFLQEAINFYRDDLDAAVPDLLRELRALGNFRSGLHPAAKPLQEILIQEQHKMDRENPAVKFSRRCKEFKALVLTGSRPGTQGLRAAFPHAKEFSGFHSARNLRVCRDKVFICAVEEAVKYEEFFEYFSTIIFLSVPRTRANARVVAKVTELASANILRSIVVNTSTDCASERRAIEAWYRGCDEFAEGFATAKKASHLVHVLSATDFQTAFEAAFSPSPMG
mmetsp:Transcript_10985/g.28918  ORF Transcript_10985/g.28918 Transcript_10985/m.28918 type:complete len:322 (+) Transcript_10985:42-1007(+)